MNDAHKMGSEAEVARIDASLVASARDEGVGRPISLEGGAEASEDLSLLEETLTVSKRKVVTGKVRVSTATHIDDEIAKVTLDRSVVDVRRVPVGCIVDTAPGVRTEGDITIVPVMEERFVVVKQLYLKEELHIRRHIEHEVTDVPVQLRRQTVVIERLDASGQPRPDASSPTA